MKKIILLLLYIFLKADNFISVKDYKLLNNTSPSLQNLIYNYHNYVKQNPNKCIFDLESINDGTEDTNNYKNYFQTKNGYKGATLMYIKARLGNDKFAIIGRQFGDENNNVNTQTEDYVFMKRSKYKSIDIMWGINLHNSPKFETVNGTQYFTNNVDTKLKFMTDIMIGDFSVSMEMNNKKIEKTLFGYYLSTKYGIFNPKLIQGYTPINYYDVYFNYDSDNVFLDYDFNLNAMIKYRKLNSKESYNSGIVSEFLELKKYFSIFSISYGYSESKEFTSQNLKGYQFSFGVSIPKSSSNNRKIKGEYYFGISKNYYSDLLNLEAINQKLALFGVKVYF